MADVEEQHQESIRFVAEQDGEPERLLKGQLQQVLTNARSVQKAYLAVVSYGDSDELDVALCLYDSAPNRNTVDSCAQTFQAVFTPTAALDILFLDSAQDLELSKVCRPFFRR